MSAGLLDPTVRALDRRLAREQSECRLPSLAAGLGRDGALVWSGGRGRVGSDPPDVDTQYRIGSITKTFAATLVMRLRDAGELRLDDRLERFVPGSPVADRTLLHLLSHGSGLGAEVPGPWWERTPGRDWPDLARALGPDAVKHEAGRRFHYSNPGTALLGLVVERVRQAPWFDVLSAEVLRPLGLTRTTYHPTAPHARGYAVHPYADVLLEEPLTDTRAMAPAGQLWSTVGDLVRWGGFLAGASVDGGEGVLAATTREEMRRPVLVEDGPDWSMAYGTGMQVFRFRGRRLVGHGGSMPGFLAGLFADQDSHASAVSLANATSGLSGSLDLDLLDLLTELEPEAPAEWRPSPVPDGVFDLLGAWFWGPRPHVLRYGGDGLLHLLPGAGTRESRFRAAGDGTWTGLDGYYAGETLQAVRRDDGTVGHLDLGTFCFTRTPYDPAAPVPGGLPDEGWTTG